MLGKNRSAVVFSFSIILLFCLASCHSVTITTDTTLQGTPNVYTAHIFLWGISGGHVNTGSDGLGRVETYNSLGDCLFTILTAGLYCPRTVCIWPLPRVRPNP